MADRHPNHRPLSSLPPELRRTTVPPAVRAWVEAHAGRRIERVRRLPGASSTAVHGVWFDDGTRLVLRRYVWSGFTDEEPEAPGRETDALRFAVAHGLPVPTVVASDVHGQEIGDGIAALLMTFVAGRAIAHPDLTELASAAAAIHAVNADDLGHEYYPWYTDTTTAPPPASNRPQLWDRAIDVWHNHMPDFDPVFVHRDFHPGNVLWSRGRVAGVVDWANSCRGPRGCDVAHCRANLVDWAGPEAAERFQREYEAITGTRHHPFWDLASTLENDYNRASAAAVRAAEDRIEHALRAMEGAALA